MIIIILLGGGVNHVLFSPLPGEWSNLTNIFRMGWNHQLVHYPLPSFSNFYYFGPQFLNLLSESIPEAVSAYTPDGWKTTFLLRR